MGHKLRKLSGTVAAATVTFLANSQTPSGAAVDVYVDAEPDSNCQVRVRLEVNDGGETVVMEGAAPSDHETVGDTGPLVSDGGWGAGVDLDDGIHFVYWDTAALGEDGLEFDIFVDGVSVVAPPPIGECDVPTRDSVGAFRSWATANSHVLTLSTAGPIVTSAGATPPPAPPTSPPPSGGGGWQVT